MGRDTLEIYCSFTVQLCLWDSLLGEALPYEMHDISYVQFKNNTNEYTCKAETNSSLGASLWLTDKEAACQCRRCGFDPGSGWSPGGGNGNPMQYSCLENPMDRGAWQATVHGVAKSWTWLSNYKELHIYPLGFPGGTSGKEPICQFRLDVRDVGSIPGSGRSPGGGHRDPL